jgi:hypothetical protein
MKTTDDIVEQILSGELRVEYIADPLLADLVVVLAARQTDSRIDHVVNLIAAMAKTWARPTRIDGKVAPESVEEAFAWLGSNGSSAL